MNRNTSHMSGQTIFKAILIPLALIALWSFVLETLFVSSRSIPWLLGQVNADGFYYYLVLAKNILRPELTPEAMTQ